MNFESFWWSVNDDDSQAIKRYFDNNAIIFLQRLIEKVISENEVAIGYAIEGNSSWSLIEYDRWNNNDKSLILRSDKSGNFEVSFEFWSDVGMETCLYLLKGDELEIIPSGLKKLMVDVVQSGKGQTARSNELRNAN